MYLYISSHYKYENTIPKGRCDIKFLHNMFFLSEDNKWLIQANAQAHSLGVASFTRVCIFAFIPLSFCSRMTLDDIMTDQPDHFIYSGHVFTQTGLYLDTWHS